MLPNCFKCKQNKQSKNSVVTKNKKRKNKTFYVQYLIIKNQNF